MRAPFVWVTVGFSYKQFRRWWLLFSEGGRCEKREGRTWKKDGAKEGREEGKGRRKKGGGGVSLSLFPPLLSSLFVCVCLCVIPIPATASHPTHPKLKNESSNEQRRSR